MERPFKDKRPFGPFFDFSQTAAQSDTEEWKAIQRETRRKLEEAME
jgi:hypothetical protein